MLVYRHQTRGHSLQANYLFNLAHVQVQETGMNDLIGNCPAIEPARPFGRFDLTEVLAT